MSVEPSGAFATIINRNRGEQTPVLKADPIIKRAPPRPDAFQDESVRSLVEFSLSEVDCGLPDWARRSHPIVRRHLGAYWKTFTPDMNAMLRLYGILTAAALLAFLIPIIYLMVIPTVTVTLVMLPLIGYVYVRILYKVGAFGVATMQSEQRGAALDVLRATPYTIREILLSKSAATIWRHVEDMALVATTTLATSLPLLLVLYHAALRQLQLPFLTAVVVVVALASVTIRIFLEAVMVTSIGIVAGASTPSRPAAVTTTVFITIAYFVLINGARLLPIDVGWILLIEIMLPLVLPIVITAVCLWTAAHLAAQ